MRVGTILSVIVIIILSLGLIALLLSYNNVMYESTKLRENINDLNNKLSECQSRLGECNKSLIGLEEELAECNEHYIKLQEWCQSQGKTFEEEHVLANTGWFYTVDNREIKFTYYLSPNKEVTIEYSVKGEIELRIYYPGLSEPYSYLISGSGIKKFVTNVEGWYVVGIYSDMGGIPVKLTITKGS